MKHRGNLTITAENADQYSALTEVAGYVYIEQGASLTAPALTEVAGYVDIERGASLTAPALTEVAGSVYIEQGASLTAPALTEVAGSVYIKQGASLTASALTKAGSVYIGQGASLTAPALTEVAGYVLPDSATAKARLRDVAAHALIDDQALDMSAWHRCETTHCVAGWAIHLHGTDGYNLERKVGPLTAGAILLGIEAAHLFHVSNAKAKKRLRAILAEEVA